MLVLKPVSDTKKLSEILYRKRYYPQIFYLKEKKIDEIVVAMPSLPGDQVRELLEFLRNRIDKRVRLETVPGISELIDGVVTFQQVRQFRIRDLLRRVPVELDTEVVENMIRGKTLLVSGAGGSIGSEIRRQAAMFSPSKLIYPTCKR